MSVCNTNCVGEDAVVCEMDFPSMRSYHTTAQYYVALSAHPLPIRCTIISHNISVLRCSSSTNTVTMYTDRG
jgi:hypothetical protein